MGAPETKGPACSECGSHSVFAAIDVKWNAEAQRWAINQTRLADDCTEIDCMDCDHRGMLDDGGFPDPGDQFNSDDETPLAAMCLWEAVCEDRHQPEPAPWDADRENEGTCALRDRILSMAKQCDSDWAHAQEHMGFDAPFDWEFAPQWLRHNYGQSFATPAERLAWLS